MENKFQSAQKMKFTKTETEYNMKSIRFLLLTITMMFIVIAGLMIVLGMSVYTHFHGFSFFYTNPGGKLFPPSIMSVLLGLILLVVTSFGFFGILKQSTCLVNLYALFLSLILICKLVVVILSFTLGPTAILKFVDIPVWSYATDPEIEYEMDRLQVTLNCCGAESYLDYMDMPFTANHSTVIVNKDVDGSLVSVRVPETCCISAGEFNCLRMRSTGCVDALVNAISQNTSVLGVLGVSVMFIQLLGVIFALLLARCIRKLKSERTLMSWKIKEQMILAREANEKNQILYINTPDSSTA